MSTDKLLFLQGTHVLLVAAVSPLPPLSLSLALSLSLCLCLSYILVV